MQLPPQISAHGLDLDPRTREFILREAATLDRFYDSVMTTRVAITVPAYQRAGLEPACYGVHIDLTVPGGELAVTRQHKPGLRQAIRDAFAVARARLQDYAREQRFDVKRHEAPTVGYVTRLFSHAGYGVIETEDGREIHFERGCVLNDGFEHLDEGTRVRFVEVPGREGPQATTVVPVHQHRRARA
jgi:cold shock CspA family protein/ribosome-associated translation inhibitor RaiA